MVKVLDFDAFVKFECEFKHLIEDHSLCWEYLQTIVSKQYAEAETEKDQENIIKKAMHVASVTSDYEEAILWFVDTFLVKEVPIDQVNGIRVEELDIRQLIWILGENALAEEHIADYIGSETKKFQDATTEEERAKIKDKTGSLLQFAYVVRSIRKKCLSGYFNKAERKQEGTK